MKAENLKILAISYLLLGACLTPLLLQITARDIYQVLVVALIFYIALQLVIPAASLTIWHYFRGQYWASKTLDLLYNIRCVMGTLNCALASIQLIDSISVSMQTGGIDWPLTATSLLLLFWGACMVIRLEKI
jgi:hypothetical protein